MKPRQTDRRRQRDQFLRQIQRLRVRGIARGEIEPASEREEGWLVNLRTGARFREDDFIIPGLLFSAERMLIELEAQEAGEEGADAQADPDAG